MRGLAVEYDDKSVGERLREAMDRRGISLRKMQEMLGGELTYSAISTYQTGKVSMSLNRLNQIAEVLGEDPVYLAFGIRAEASKPPTSKNIVMTDVPAKVLSDGMLNIPEVSYGVDRSPVIDRCWSVSEDYITRKTSSVAANLFLTEVLVDGYGGIERTDMVIVDKASNNPLRPGVYLTFKPFSPEVCHLSPRVDEDGVKINVEARCGQTLEVPRSVEVLGKVVGVIKRV
jgi:transcriptional regulator with XRE-family HTH domain